jgi:hypothetical protein
MMLAVTVATLIGTWICTSPPDAARFRFHFGTGGAGTFTLLDRFGRDLERGPFTYRITDPRYDEMLEKSPDGAPTLDHVRVRGRTLEIESLYVERDGHWFAPSSKVAYHCRRP